MVRKQVSKNPTVLLIRISTVDPVVAHMCLGMSADTNHDSSDGLPGSTKCRMLLFNRILKLFKIDENIGHQFVHRRKDDVPIRS